MPATSYNPDIFFILFRAKDSRVKYFNGGRLTILSMQFEDIESFSTLFKVLNTDVSSLSIGGTWIKKNITKKMILIYAASEAGLPFFSYHKDKAFDKGVLFPAILVYKL